MVGRRLDENTYISNVDDLNQFIEEYFGTPEVLDLGDRRGHTDYIDFLLPADLVGSNVTDVHRRRGVAFHMVMKQAFESVPEGYEVVIALFQRYTNGSGLSFGNGRSDATIANVIRVHAEDREDEPIRSMCWRVGDLADIVQGRHPYVGLV